MAASRLFFLNYGKKNVLFPDDSTAAGKRMLINASDPNGMMNPGSNDWAVEIMFYWDSTMLNQSTGKQLIGKFDPSTTFQPTAGVPGWQIRLNASQNGFDVVVSDGTNVGASTFYGAMGPNGFCHCRFEFVRSAPTPCCNLYTNGNIFATKTGVFSGVTGALNNAAPVTVGGLASYQPNMFLKGAIHLLRLDLGYDGYAGDESGNQYCLRYNTNYGSVWNKEAYLKIAHFWPQDIQHYALAWYFNNSLVDISPTAYTWSVQDGNGSAAAMTYGGGPFWGQGYTMPFDPLPGGNEWGPIDFNDRKRALDGTLKIYRPGYTKMHKTWKFRTSDLEQVYAILGAYYQVSVIEVHDYTNVGPNQVNLPFAMKGYFASAPVVTEIARRGDPTNINSLFRVWEITAEFIEA